MYASFGTNGILKLTKYGLSPKGFCTRRSVTPIEWLKRIIATGICIFGDAATFKEKDCGVLFGLRYFYCPFGSSRALFDSKVQPGVGKFVYI